MGLLDAMNTASRRFAPGPKGHWLFGNLNEFRRDVLGFLADSARSFGDVVHYRVGPQHIHLLNHPDHIAHVLLGNHRNFDKNTRSAAAIRKGTGESLLTSNGEVWKRQRRQTQPFFHRRNISRFVEDMTTATGTMLKRWRDGAAKGQPLDIASEMMRLTYEIVGRTIFNADVGADAQAVERAMPVVLAHTFGRLERLINLPDWVPTPRNRRYRQAVADIDAVVFRIIDEHRQAEQTNGPGRDLLSMLLHIQDEETGEVLTDGQLRNATLTLLLAGHETTANALVWTFYLLSQHPVIEGQLRDEVRAVLGDRPPTLDDLALLPYTKMVIKEALRLYPPIWIIERRVIADDTIGGYYLPAGSAVIIAPYVLHRHPGFWDEPEVFNPARFTNPARAAYMPFGAGERYCIGSEFAMLEAQLITAMVAQAFRLELVPGHRVEPWPNITLRMRHGLLMTPHPESGA